MRPMSAPAILVLDSGLGGLTVYREVAAARPDAKLVYVADDAAFPYGNMREGALAAHLVSLVEQLCTRYRPDLVVIACNTASTLVLSQLRERIPIRFVGTVPAIKPACSASRSKLVSVLGTQATVSREYTRALIRQFSNGSTITLVGSGQLAFYAEAELHGEPVADASIRQEIAPCFVETGSRRTDTVVLACTHYPLLLARLTALAPWPVSFVDPAPAIARRVVDLLGPAVARSEPCPSSMLFTSGRPPSAPLEAALAPFGLTNFSAERFDTPRVSA